MDDISAYQIQIRGQVAEDDLNSTSPLKLQVEKVEANCTSLRICADQAGLVGLIRHLHGLGFVLLSVQRLSVDPGE